MTVLSAERVPVACRRGSPACRVPDEVALTLHSGTVTLLRGPLGSGKTALLSVLGGLRHCRVRLNGVDLHSRADAHSATSRRRFFEFIAVCRSALPPRARPCAVERLVEAL